MEDEERPPKYAELLDSFNKYMIAKKHPADSTRKKYISG
jgi:hypothetical protein